MKNLLTRPHPFERAVVMLQKEVIERLAAKPGTKDYGILSLRTQADWVVEPQRTVPPEAFHPRPKIDSAVAVLRPRTSGLPAFDRRLFDELIRRGFAQRRKQLGKQLPAGTPWQEIAANLKVPVTVRAEELTLEQWVDLTRACDVHPLKDLPQKSAEIFDVVDVNDVVIGRKTRDEVHAGNLLHRAVHVFVYNKRGDLLLQQRSMFKDVHPGVWGSSVSGHLDAGEDYTTAVLLERRAAVYAWIAQASLRARVTSECPMTRDFPNLQMLRDGGFQRGGCHSGVDFHLGDDFLEAFRIAAGNAQHSHPQHLAGGHDCSFHLRRADLPARDVDRAAGGSC